VTSVVGSIAALDEQIKKERGAADPAFAMEGLQPDQPYPETVPGLT